MNITFKLLSIFLAACFKIGYSQIPNNTLFLIIDKSNKLVEVDNKEKIKINYTVRNEEHNWYSYIYFINKPKYLKNHIKYLLPKEMFSEFKDRGNVLTSNKFETMLMPLKWREARDLIKLRYPRYYYEFFDGPELKKDLRYGIFLVFKSDLEKDFIECYEASLTFDLINQH